LPAVPRKRLYDTEFSIRLKMALHHKGVAWQSPQAVGDFFGRSRQTAHQWLNGTIPDARDELWLVEEKLAIAPARWLVTGKDAPGWVAYINPDKFRNVEHQEPLTRRRKKK
jgi:hypothetical protein